MRPGLWQLPIEPSEMERSIIKRIRRAKLFVFLRQHRHELFNEAFQLELSTLYQDSKRGSHLFPPRNERWRPSCRPIQGSLMMK